MQRTTEPPRRSDVAAARRNRIMAAAQVHFLENGFHATGVAQIAKTAKVHIGQFYRDFPSKEEIIAAIVEEDVNARFANPIIDPDNSRDKFIEQIRKWTFDLYSDVLDSTRPNLFPEIVAEASRNPRIALIIQSVDARLRRLFLDALKSFDGEERSDEERDGIADLFMTLISGLGSRLVVQPDVDAHRLAINATALVIDRIRTGLSR